jgi:hypothetical protein
MVELFDYIQASVEEAAQALRTAKARSWQGNGSRRPAEARKVHRRVIDVTRIPALRGSKKKTDDRLWPASRSRN